MKRNLSGHTGKNRDERKVYSDYIKSQDYTPTVDESLKFNDTTDDDNEFSVEKNKKRRKRPFREIIQEKLEENWFQIILSIVAFVLVFFTIDAKVGLAKLFERTENINSTLGDIKNEIKDNNSELVKSIDEIEKKNHNQDLRIQKNDLIIQNFGEHGNSK